MEEVVANLVATYNLNSTDEKSVMDIDYLCIYEYEYNGKKYKYRTHQKDNFEPIPEQLELCFYQKNPEKAFKKRKTNTDFSNDSKEKKSTSLVKYIVYAVCFIFIAIIIYIFYKLFKIFTVVGDIKHIFIFIIAVVLISLICIKKEKNTKGKDELLEDAIVNNRTATAYLKKERFYNPAGNLKELSPALSGTADRVYFKDTPYQAIYTYEYNGKKYKKTIWFASKPPKTIRVYFNKNPKDIIKII